MPPTVTSIKADCTTGITASDAQAMANKIDFTENIGAGRVGVYVDEGKVVKTEA